MLNNSKFIFFVALLAPIAGCSSFGKGVTEAILESQLKEDIRVCEVKGKSFHGVNHQLDMQGNQVKVLMVHGVGEHLPGYSTKFFEKLASALFLTVESKQFKNITLVSKDNPERKLGNLRVKRFLSSDKTREMLGYELTWSEITAPQKKFLAYDNSGEHSFRRAEVNDLLKRFSNDKGPDPIIYLGDSRQEILQAFTQSFCWMTSGHWDELPADMTQACFWQDNWTVEQDNYAVVSHSLGSRITIDGMQHIAAQLSKGVENKMLEQLVYTLKQKNIPVYMMSNQLPMLQLGRQMPMISDQEAEYCKPTGAKYEERILSGTPIYAFSDPNDLLSYTIPHDFVTTYLDSRLCIDVTNININIASVIDVFGLGKMANPLEAHVGYDSDDRVIALIANGIGHENANSLVKERCRWIETID